MRGIEMFSRILLKKGTNLFDGFVPFFVLFEISDTGRVFCHFDKMTKRPACISLVRTYVWGAL